MIEAIFNFTNSTVSKKSIQHDNFMHIFPSFDFPGGWATAPPCPWLRAPMIQSNGPACLSYKTGDACEGVDTVGGVYMEQGLNSP